MQPRRWGKRRAMAEPVTSADCAVAGSAKSARCHDRGVDMLDVELTAAAIIEACDTHPWALEKLKARVD